MRDGLPERREHGDRVEYSPEIGERSEDEIRDDRNPIKRIGKESIQESDEREEQGCQKRKEERESYMGESDVRKEESNSENQSTSQETPKNPSGYEPKYYDRIGRGRHQYLLDIFLKLRHIERWNCIHERTRYDRHHNKTRHDEFHVAFASDGGELRSDKLSEYHIIEGRRDDGRNEGLCPDPEKAGNLLSDDCPVGYKESV